MNKNKYEVKNSLTRNAIISKMALLLSFLCSAPSRVEFKAARKTLNLYSPKPDGSCYSDNKICITFDIQLIIPAYNVEKYVQKCLSSIIPIFHNEKICVQIVDDGSTDTTSKLIDKFSDRIHENVVVIHQENKGLSECRSAPKQTKRSAIRTKALHIKKSRTV
jgi:cellulose synthase/poly-beta-1,6-N-acetylglucosamine synthase-like glycosyltransferase